MRAHANVGEFVCTIRADVEEFIRRITCEAYDLGYNHGETEARDQTDYNDLISDLVDLLDMPPSALVAHVEALKNDSDRLGRLLVERHTENE